MTTKNKLHYFGLLALIIVMVLAACPVDPASEKGTETLTISGQVNERKPNEALMGLLDLEDTENLDIFSLMGVLSDELISYIPINGNMTVSDGGMGGTGQIENGRLSYSIQKPADEAFVSVTEYIGVLTQMLGEYLSDEILAELGIPALSELYANIKNIKISPADTRAAPLILLINNDAYSFIDRELIKNTFSIGNLTITVEGVGYVYVDKKATITAKGASITELPELPVNLTLPNISLNLKKGWNALGVKVTVTAKMIPSLSISGKVEYSCRQPSKVSDSLKWVANPPIESSEESLVPPAFPVPVE